MRSSASATVKSWIAGAGAVTGGDDVGAGGSRGRARRRLAGPVKGEPVTAVSFPPEAMEYDGDGAVRVIADVEVSACGVDHGGSARRW